VTRRDTVWWAGFVPTSPASLLQRPEGDRLLGLLADWWIAEEGLLDPQRSRLGNNRRAVSRRYRQEEFYRRLAAAGFPQLSDRDEHAVDTVLRVFIGWASSGKASELVESIEQKEAARGRVLRGLDTGAAPLGLGLIAHQRSRDEFESLVIHEVHEQVHARARALIEAEVKAQLRAELPSP
jgi:hypothetical protein